MAESPNTKELAELRKPFSEESMGLLPKVSCYGCTLATKAAKSGLDKHCDRHSMSKCKDCDNYITEAHIHLDYVGHAAVTDRLLQVDPQWHWEPLGVDEHGLPMTDKAGNLWIHLTVLGVTRIGVGDGSNAKECIGDAIRNAAMRFGVALDLWTKEELESTLEDPSLKNDKPSQRVQQPSPSREEPKTTTSDKVLEVMTDDDAPTDAQLERIRELRVKLGYNSASTEARIKMLKSKGQAGASIAKLKAELSEQESREGVIDER